MQQTLTPDFIDYSESVNTLINSGGSAPQSLLGKTFTSRADFEKGSAAQPAVPFTIKNTVSIVKRASQNWSMTESRQQWTACDVITVRWESDQSPQPVVGISVLHTKFTGNLANPSLWSINEVWAEFDSGAWLVNLGILKPSSKKEKREIAFEA
jgi:hypothetical protein